MSFAARLALLYATTFGALGIQMPFLPVWLAARGFDDGTIGTLLALAALARIGGAPLAAWATDRFGALKPAIVAAAAGTAAATVLLPLGGSVLAAGAALVVAAAAASALFPLSDAYALQGLRARGRAYGPVRLWGSVAFVAGNLAAGLLAQALGARDIVWAIAATYGLAAVAAAQLVPLPPCRSRHGASPSKVRPGRAPPLPLALALAASSLIQGSHAFFYGFGSLAWRAQGLDAASVGALWAVGVVAEIALFALSGRLAPRLTPSALLAIGGAGAALRWFAMAQGPPAALLPVLQCFHALSFAATHLGAVQLLARLAPASHATTAQGVLAMSNSAVSAAATFASGLLYARFGTAGYGAMAILACAGLVPALALVRMRADAAAQPQSERAGG